MKAAIVCCLMFGVVLAGCLDGGPEDVGPVTGPSLPALSDMVCDFAYPGNETPVPCENQFTVVNATGTEQPTLLDEWLCVDENQSEGVYYSIHWDPLTDNHGIYYQIPDNDRPVSGILYSTSGGDADERVQVAWYDEGSTGFIPLPSLAQGPTGSSGFAVMMYALSFNTTTPALEGGTLRAYWSIHDASAYPLQVLETESENHYFHNVTVHDRPNFPYTIEEFDLEGEDFNITVDHQRFMQFTDAFTNYPLHQCTL